METMDYKDLGHNFEEKLTLTDKSEYFTVSIRKMGVRITGVSRVESDYSLH